MPTIEVSQETLDKIKDQLGEDFKPKDINGLDDLTGGSYFFRTVTYHLVGKVKKVSGRLIELEDASWVASSGRFMNAIKEGVLDEVEPVGVAFLNFETVCDFFPWKHKLPLEQI